MIVTESDDGLPEYHVIEVLGFGGVRTAEYVYGALRAATTAATAKAAAEAFELDYELEVVSPEELLPGEYVLLWEEQKGREVFKVLVIR